MGTFQMKLELVETSTGLYAIKWKRWFRQPLFYSFNTSQWWPKTSYWYQLSCWSADKNEVLKIMEFLSI